MIYILYKSYLSSLVKLNEFIYSNMSHDISRLNWNYPIYSYVENIPNINHINYIYHKLDISNYNDYIYNIYQNSQLFGDLAEQYLKRLVKLFLPLVLAIGLLGGTLFVEHSQMLSIIN